MTIEREGRNGPFVIECDVCNETYECMGEDFSDSIQDAFREGWFSINRGSRNHQKWRHYCSQGCAKTED